MTVSLAAEADVPVIEVDGRKIATDDLGYLLDPSEWTPAVAEFIAVGEHISLSDDHWTMIHFVRDWFEERQAVPEARSTG